MANHTIPIDGGGGGIPVGLQPPTIPWGDTITVLFKEEARLIHIQTPLLPAAFDPPIPMGHFYPGDRIGPRKAQRVTATVKFVYMIAGSPVAHTITVKVAEMTRSAKKKLK